MYSTNAIFSAPFYWLESPTCHRAASYGAPAYIDYLCDAVLIYQRNVNSSMIPCPSKRIKGFAPSLLSNTLW